MTATTRDGSRRPAALLVDDRPENLLALEAVLEPLQLRTVRATSGKEALRWLLTDDFAVIILDVQMPELDGFETARHIKAREKTRGIPIIFLTALSTEREHQLKGYGSGAVDYVSKPFDPDVLRAKVEVLIELHHQAEVIEEQRALLAHRLSELERAQQAMGAQASELERSNAELDRIATTVAREVRDPLHLARGFLQLLKADGTSGPEDSGVLLERADAAVGRAFDVLDDVLRYARSAVGVVTHDPLPVVSGDRWQLRELLSCLIGHAIDQAGDPPCVHVGLSRRDDSWVLSVRDNGAGLEPGAAVGLFAADGPDSDLRLASGRRIVERHGGTIWAESAPGRGTLRHFTLPLAVPA